MINGIDVSKWQGVIDWELVRQTGKQFVMVRASYGTNGVDPYFVSNAEKANKAGIQVGAYHYCYALTTQDAFAEARHFLNTVSGSILTYPLALDMEDASLATLSKQALTEISLVFLEEIKKAGYYPILYANRNWLENKLDMSILDEYDVWLAEYREGGYIYRGKVDMWQFSSSGSVNGIHGAVDMDESYHDYETVIRTLGLNHLKGSEDMSVEEAIQILVKMDVIQTGEYWVNASKCVLYLPKLLVNMAEAMEKLRDA